MVNRVTELVGGNGDALDEADDICELEVDESDVFIGDALEDAFAEGVEAVASGRLTARAASEADDRLDPLDE